MRFESIANLLTFLSVLGALGFRVPIIADIKEDMISKGLDKHISYYTWKIAYSYEDSTLSLSVFYYKDTKYTITLKKERK